jgi:hypothetical protein
MQIVLQATVFLAGGWDQGAKLGFKEKVLTLFGAHYHH